MKVANIVVVASGNAFLYRDNGTSFVLHFPMMWMGDKQARRAWRALMEACRNCPDGDVLFASSGFVHMERRSA